MAGFREYAPGQVWFYYNPSATKSLEQKKELGSCTSRPVVIIQSAFYMEWNDIVTVCPMTKSDRRSGVYIDSTILKDGSLIEGGTVIPYLFYNIRTKYLFPVVAENQKRKLLTLADEDFEKVMHGVQYHMGFTKDPPDYVKEWKHLSDFDRGIIIQDVRLAVNAYDDLAKGQYRDKRRGTTNPVLRQEPPTDITRVENHIIGSMTEYDRQNHTLISPGDMDAFNQRSLSSMTDEDPIAIIDHANPVKIVNKKPIVTFTQFTAEEFSDVLSSYVEGVYPVPKNHENLYAGSKFLESTSLKDMPSKLTQTEKFFILIMPISDIIKQSGIRSTSTAMRLRKALKEMDWGSIGHTDETGSFIPDCENWSEGFRYTGNYPFTKMRVKKSMKRRAAVFKIPKNELVDLLMLNDEDLVKRLNLPLSYAANARADISTLVSFSNQANSDTPTADSISPTERVNSIQTLTMKYEFEDTLSESEYTEFMNCPQKNISSLVSNFGITKAHAKKIRSKIREAKKGAQKCPEISEAEFDKICRDAVLSKISESSLTRDQMLIFCRSNPKDILASYQRNRLAFPPSKAETRRIKAAFRRILTT